MRKIPKIVLIIIGTIIIASELCYLLITNLKSENLDESSKVYDNMYSWENPDFNKNASITLAEYGGGGVIKSVKIKGNDKWLFSVNFFSPHEPGWTSYDEIQNINLKVLIVNNETKVYGCGNSIDGTYGPILIDVSKFITDTQNKITEDLKNGKYNSELPSRVFDFRINGKNITEIYDYCF